MTEAQKEANRKATREYYARKKNDPEWRAKQAARSAKWRKENPEKHKANQDRCKAAKPEKYKRMRLKAHLKQRYGITIEEYDELMERAGYQCEHCGGTSKLCVDHCHATGKVRGILCNKCNTGLGRLGDDYESIKKMADYLKERG